MMKRKLITTTSLLMGIFLMLVPLSLHAGQDYMAWSVKNSTVTPNNPYIEFHVNYYNDKWDDSWVKDNIYVTVNGTKWTIDGYGGDGADGRKDRQQRWTYDKTLNGMRCIAGYPYKSGDDFYVKIIVYPTQVYDQQTFNFSWSATYVPDRDGYEKACSANGSGKASFPSDKCLSEPTYGSSGLHFNARTTTPNTNDYTYDFYLLKSNEPVSNMISSTDTKYSAFHVTKKAATAVMEIDVNKTPANYFQRNYYPRYTATYNGITFFLSLSKELFTPYPLNGTGTKDDPFLIFTDKELDIFRQMVNESHQNSICGKLMADIDYSAYSSTANMIGTSDYPYSGTFDGNGKSIKIGFNVSELKVGLFRFANNATITNLQLTGTLKTSKNVAGLIVGNVSGNTTLSYIVNKATLDCSFSGDAALGGFIGEINPNGKVNISYCAFKGSLVGNKAAYSGGFIGWLFNNTEVKVGNSLFAPQQVTVGTNDSYTFIRKPDGNNKKVSFTCCYYTVAFGAAQGEQVTDAQMRSGEVCYKLNGSNNNNAVWLQTIGVDSQPTLWESQRVYCFNGLYMNSMPQLKGAGTLVDPFLIGSPTELESFRDLVNMGLSTLCARLTADIDMSDRNWIPIGRHTVNESMCRVNYRGTFNGDGFTISNLSSHSEEDHDMGLIGRSGDGCTVKNLLMHNVQLEGHYRCAPIIGLVNGKTTVDYCGVTGVVKLLCSEKNSTGTGGIACAEGNLTVSHSYTSYSNIIGYGKLGASSMPYSYCNIDSVKAVSGELCYNLNGSSTKNVVWRQTLGKQTYPKIRVGKKVDKSGGKYVNLEYVDGDNSTYNNPLASEDLKIIHHGGRLYEFIVTLGTSDGEIWHAFPNMALSYKDDDTWVDFGQFLNINRERLSFDKEWSGEMKSLKGTFVNSHTFQLQTPVFWINHSTQKNKKQASLLWVVPDDVKTLPKEFRFSSSVAGNNLVITGLSSDVMVPTDGSIVMMEPQINPQTTEPGSQMGTITLMGNAYSLGFWDSTDNKFISAQEFPDGVMSLQYVLPPVERIHDIVALMYGEKIFVNGMAMDTCFVTYSYPFRQKPMHSIIRSNAKATYNGSNSLKWAIAYPEDKDIIAEDQFEVFRAYQSDYSDATSISSFALSGYTSQTTEKDTLWGWYSFRDESPEGKTTSVKFDDTKSAFDDWDLKGQAKTILTAYKYPARYIYYKVARTTPNSLWGDTKPFTKTWKALLTNVLPQVDTIRVSKASDWDDTHRVILRLKLLNPYPYQLVPANEQKAVREEAERQGFTDRMFLWDENAKIIIKRSSPTDEWYQDKDEVAKTIEVNGSNVEYNAAEGYYYVDVEDLQTAPNTHYYYEAYVDASLSSYPICSNMNQKTRSSDADAINCFSTVMPKIHDFTATKGDEYGIKLSWGIDTSLKADYKLVRKLFKSGYDSKLILPDTTLIDGEFNASEIFDEDVLAANAYEFDLKTTVTFRGKKYDDEVTTHGYKNYKTGSISGRVQMANGMSIPGDAKVRISLYSPKHLQVNEVLVKDKSLIMPGFSADATVLETTVNSDGSYSVEGLCFYGNGIQYEVQAIMGGVEFAGPSGSPTIILTLDDHRRNYTDIDFICSKTRQFSGRILYANSTVPVSDMQFTVNDKPLLKDGKPVVTDSKGNFNFTLPQMQMKIKASKAGHRLSDNGCILGGPNKNDSIFTPTEDYAGLVLTDSTTIRLVGRVAGGDVEGAKPIGFGVTENIIGDSITLVLQLEGDNTSYLYFNRKDPDKTSERVSFRQTVREGKKTEEAIPTDVVFESKRIVVKAHKTGEFCLDLVPAKYKISQIFAEGYSTLYGEGEGIQTLDLTNQAIQATYKSGSKETDYCAAYNRIYHAPVTVTLSQRGSAVFGTGNIEVNTITGNHKIDVAWTDEKTKKPVYAFNYPVFVSGQTYGFTVKVQEEFKYNNNPAKPVNKVKVPFKKVVLVNGLIDGSPVIEKELDINSSADFININPNNTTFSFTGKDALVHVRAMVEIDGRKYESDTLKAFVTGTRDNGVFVAGALTSDPKLIDIIRDPYGSGSYAFREKGTTYKWAWNYESIYQRYFQMSLSAGFAYAYSLGFLLQASGTFNLPLLNFDLKTITKHTIEQKNGEYTFTANERIATSSDPHDVGAMADVYIGRTDKVDIRKYQSFNVIDSESYASLGESVRNGSTKLVSKGKDKDGKDVFMIIGEGAGFSDGGSAMFIYSQKHILGTLIPELEKQRDMVFRKVADFATAEKLSKATHLTYYYKDGDNYKAVLPDTKVKTDSVSLYNDRIRGWQNLIRENDSIKYNASISKDTDDSAPKKKSYSVAGADIDYSEQSTSYYRVLSLNGPKYTITSGGSGANQQPSGQTTTTTTDKNGKEKTETHGWGILFSLSLVGGNDKSATNQFSDNITEIAGSGYHLSTTDNSTIDMDVYQVVDDSLKNVTESFYNTITAFEKGEAVEGLKKTFGGTLLMTSENSSVHNYVFVQRGGATRNPWIDADSTFFYNDSKGNHYPLGVRTQRIDNPKIYVENPVINNQPQDEAAVFKIRLANETEINDKTKYLNPSTLYLNIDERSNTDGAKISIDGVPVRNSVKVFLNPGESTEKTIEVARGGKADKYEDLKLQFTDDPDYWKLCDEAKISVYYVPTSSPVNISMPADNWLMNTYSQTDKDGRYYIPVQIDGFSTTQYDNFDHIELQYKKKTESEDQWVNLCSYYADTVYYNKGTGTKEMITTNGKITNIRFYGENDPVEMKYDLRAVSFCRLGNGYVTRNSNVVSGTKDTRRPDVFGIPKPADGILNFDDVISLPFSEGIAYNYLDETVNFSVQGYTNNSDADHSSYLYFPGNDTQLAISKVERTLSNHDFTMEAMVKVEGTGTQYDNMAIIMSILDSEGYSSNKEQALALAYDTGRDALVGVLDENTFYSEPLNTHKLTLRSAMTHVAMTYTAEDNLVRFYVDDVQVPLSKESKADDKKLSHAYGPVMLGNNLKGSIGDVRLWNKALTTSEVATKYKKILSDHEKNLIGYWPMIETDGDVVADIVSGADIYLSGVSWQTPDGYSLRADKSPIRLTSKAELKFTRNNTQDYSLSFWFRADDRNTVRNTTLFSAGDDKLDEKGKDKMRIAFKDSLLVLVSEGNTISFGATADNFNASTWHNVCIAVNRSLNVASLFIDGDMVNEISAELIGGLASSYIAFGGNGFVGNFDNISLWNIALPAYVHSTFYNTGLTGSEPELAVNMNFEQDLTNPQGSMYVAFSPYNNVIVPATGKIAEDIMVDETKVTPDQKIHAPIRSGAGLQNLPFSWSSNGSELLININKADADINHQHLNLVVRNVEDLNGNVMKNPKMWSVYVNRNALEWEERNCLFNLPVGKDTTFIAKWKNKSGRVISYRLETTASWLKLSNTMGNIQPLDEGAAILTITDGLTPGFYSATVYLTDENNLVSSFTVNVLVSADFTVPEVTTDPEYSSSMNFIAKVMKRNSSGNWSIDIHPKDVVCAFIDKVCVGRSHLTIDAANSTSMLYMTVLGNYKLNKKPIEFRLYSASDGQIYDLETGNMVKGEWVESKQVFTNNKIVGSDMPLEMRTTLRKIQSITLTNGWNWVSFNVKPIASNGLNDLFLDKDVFTIGDVFTSLGHKPSLFQSDGKWDSNFDDVLFAKDNVYQIYVQDEGSVTVKGNAIDESDRTVTLRFKGSDWADLAYLLDVSQPINIALSDFQAGSTKAPAGTVIKSHDQFAVAQKDGSWVGSLQYLRPGEGYYVKRNGLRESVTVKYTNSTINSAPERQEFATVEGLDASKYPTSMPVIATIREGQYREGDVLLAVCGDRIVGYAEISEDGSLFFLNVNAQEGSAIRFANLRGGTVVGITTKSVSYDATGVLGSLQSPYVIDFTETGAESVYDLTGIKYSDIESLNARRGVFIINGKKKLR